MALFIVFEGGEGCGKSTQARALHRRLRSLGLPAILTREPGGTRLGERIRRTLKEPGAGPISPLAELFLLEAARSQLASEVVRPALSRGCSVICDRFTPSTLAYQGYGRGLDLNAIEKVNRMAAGSLVPDLLILLDVPAEVGLGRKRAPDRDRFELEGLSFHQRVRRGYHKLAEAEPAKWLVVNGALSRKAIAEAVWERVSGLLSGRADA